MSYNVECPKRSAKSEIVFPSLRGLMMHSYSWNSMECAKGGIGSCLLATTLACGSLADTTQVEGAIEPQRLRCLGDRALSDDACSLSTMDCEAFRALSIRGSVFFPDSIAADANLNLYVGSIVAGSVLKMDVANGDQSVLAGPSGYSTLGLAVDSAGQRLWRCSVDLSFEAPSVLEVLDLNTGEVLATHGFPVDTFCNGVALDVHQNAYVTDSQGQRVFRVSNADALNESRAELWLGSTLFEAPFGESGLNGITFAGESTVFLSHLYQGRVFRVEVSSDGSAGEPSAVEAADELTAPDGIYWGENALWITEFGSGELSKLIGDREESTYELVEAGLDAPSSVAVAGGVAWVVESQADHILDMSLGPAEAPFNIVAVPGCASQR